MRKFLLQFLLAVICLWQAIGLAAEKPGLHPDGMTRADLEEILGKYGTVEVVAMIKESVSERNIKFRELLESPIVGPEALAPYADLVNIVLDCGQLPLNCVLCLPKSEKTYAKMQLLCDQGADVEHNPHPWGSKACLLFTPLYDAVKTGDCEAARILLAAGAKINAEVRKLIDDREVHPKICKMIADEAAIRQRWQGREGLRGAWAKASVSVATGAAVPVGPLQTMPPGPVTAEDLELCQTSRALKLHRSSSS